MHANHLHFTNPQSYSGGRDLGMLGVMIHVIGDALNNIAVIASAAAIWWGKTEGRYYADPAVSMGIAFMIFASSIPLGSFAPLPFDFINSRLTYYNFSQEQWQIPASKRPAGA